jgi:hypothetical protein
VKEKLRPSACVKVHEREELGCNIPDRMWARPMNGEGEKGKCKPGDAEVNQSDSWWKFGIL